MWDCDCNARKVDKLENIVSDYGFESIDSAMLFKHWFEKTNNSSNLEVVEFDNEFWICRR